jgi:hypothetical protein
VKCSISGSQAITNVPFSSRWWVDSVSRTLPWREIPYQTVYFPTRADQPLASPKPNGACAIQELRLRSRGTNGPPIRVPPRAAMNSATACFCASVNVSGGMGLHPVLGFCCRTRHKQERHACCESPGFRDAVIQIHRAHLPASSVAAVQHSRPKRLRTLLKL